MTERMICSLIVRKATHIDAKQKQQQKYIYKKCKFYVPKSILCTFIIFGGEVKRNISWTYNPYVAVIRRLSLCAWNYWNKS